MKRFCESVDSDHVARRPRQGLLDGGSLLDSSDASSGPRKWEDDDPINSLIAKELLELSIEDRETLFEEVHGVANLVEETPELVEKSLTSLQKALNWNRSKSAYEQAKFIRPSCVEDRFLRLAMLRSANYNAIEAAKRMVNYFQFKLELFGLNSLVRPVAQSDLTPDMQSYLESGGAQLLPLNDRVGRPVMILPLNLDENVASKVWAGIMMYLLEQMIKNEIAQKKGCIFVIFAYVGPKSAKAIMDRRSKISMMLDESSPIRIVAMHYCFKNPILRHFFSVIQMAITSQTRLRVKKHFGSPMECSYKLMSFGVVASSLPTDQNGDIENSKWRRTVELMRQKEEVQAAHNEGLNEIIPRKNDCLLGRGCPFRLFPGNIMLNSVIYLNLKGYAELKRFKKGTMVYAIVQYYRDVRGSRFLKRSMVDSSWTLASHDEAMSKVGSTIRHPFKFDFTGVTESFTSENGVTIVVPAMENTRSPARRTE